MSLDVFKANIVHNNTRISTTLLLTSLI